MDDAARQLTSLLERYEPILRQRTDVSEETTGLQWSPVEILGHLIDSASNNHQRFVRMQLVPVLHFPDYQHENRLWVRAQAYANCSWSALVDLWTALNRHLIHLLTWAPEDAAEHVWLQGNGSRIPLRRLAADYVEHLEHHLRQLAPSNG